MILRARVLILAAVLTGMITACGSPQRQIPTGSASAEVDSRTGSIALPQEKYELSPQEEGIFSTANDLAMHRCMETSGYPEFFPFVDRRNPKIESNRRYGVWVRAEVARYGYLPPPPSARGRRLLAINRIKMPPAADKAYQACIPQLRRMRLQVPDAPADTSRGAGLEDSDPSDTKKWKAVRSEWISCLTDHDTPNIQGDGWVPAGMMEAPREVQIRVGLIDVACKEKVHLVKRLADLDAQARQPDIEKHEAELVAHRRELDALMVRSRAYLAGAPELPAS